jgi:hypothetical protein
MGALAVILALVHCELKARYNGIGGWQVSAKGALPVILMILAMMQFWMH